MIGRKRARAVWFNVYETPKGNRTRSLDQQTREAAKRQAALHVAHNNRKLLYRVRVRRFIEPELPL